MDMKIYRTIAETVCPNCKTALEWDALDDITSEKVLIGCWCNKCRAHRTLEIKRDRRAAGGKQ